MRRLFAVHRKGLVVQRNGDTLEVPPPERFGDVGDTFSVGADAVAAAVTDIPSGCETMPLRALAVLFDEPTFALAGRAFHVVDWATTSRFCGRCGTATVRAERERAMACPSCKLSLWPRIAPAIIVLVRRGEEALLARNPKFPSAFYSTLAGFSDVGESLEETVVREVGEEVGIGVTNIRYFGSQPWPFPHSLMIGFTAEWAGGDIRVDGEEITDARWFRADALPDVPPPISIARRLIDAWVADVSGGSTPSSSAARTRP